VAIANQRLLDMDDGHVRFRYTDYRAASSHTPKTMTLDAPEFIRRFLLHVLPTGFHRIRYYGWLGPHATSPCFGQWLPLRRQSAQDRP
jgi:hypothetical protein